MADHESKTAIVQVLPDHHLPDKAYTTSLSQESTPWLGQSPPETGFEWGPPLTSSSSYKRVDSTPFDGGQYTRISPGTTLAPSSKQNSPHHDGHCSHVEPLIGPNPTNALSFAEEAVQDCAHTSLSRGLHERQSTASVLVSCLSGIWIMYACFLLGVLGAMYHHFYYKSLHDQEAIQYDGALRKGSLLAFLSKAAFASAVSSALKQQIWATVHRRKLRIRTIDDLFLAAEQPIALISLGMITKAKIAWALSALLWLLALIVVMAPTSLTVASKQHQTNTTCNSVRTLNFDMERTHNWRNPRVINRVRSSSMTLKNQTMNVDDPKIPFNQTFFDYYSDVKPNVELLMYRSAVFQNIIAINNDSALICGSGWNCTYTLSFEAPGYKCDTVAQGVGNNDDAFRRLNAPFNTSCLLPEGQYSYFAKTDMGEYMNPQVATQIGGIPSKAPPFPADLGVFRTEPVIWVGHSEWKSNGAGVLPDRNNSKWIDSFIPKIHKCEHYITRYTVVFKHNSGVQLTEVTNKEYLRRLVETDFVPNKQAFDDTNDPTVAVPIGNYVRPLDVENYRFVGSYHALGKVLRSWISGYVNHTQPSLPKAGTSLSKTSLLNAITFLPVDNFIPRLQSLYEEMIFNILSYPRFVVVTWANESEQYAGNYRENLPVMPWPCTKSKMVNTFVYNGRELWLVYALAIALSLIAINFGTAAIMQNNYHVRDTRFSSIIAASRAAAIDELPWKRSRWGEVPSNIYHSKLEYGLISDGNWAINGRRRDLETSDSSTYYGFAPEGRANHGVALPRASSLSVLSFKTRAQS